jgi:RNA polymerase subunit RPABC4/transcription elongation factor Spt4
MICCDLTEKTGSLYMPFDIELPPIVDVILQYSALFLGFYLAALVLGMVIWTIRDIRARTHDIFSQILAVLLVLFLNLPGLFLYLILRPRETLAEGYERLLAEEALLQEIEDRRLCPGCGQRIESGWLLCPMCRTELKQKCSHCGELLALDWKACPYCARPVSTPEPSGVVLRVASSSSSQRRADGE